MFYQVENNEFNVSLVGMKQLGVSSNTSSATINNKSIVVKRINRSPQNMKELNHMYKHPNIVEYLGSNEDENKCFLIMPHANNGNLRNYIKDNTLSYKKKMEIAINIANGIMFLHTKGIVHGNLNPKNILIFDGVAKISNLPLHKDLYLKNKEMYFDDNLFDNIGYIDPNSILNRNYEKDKSTDIYSFGSLLFEIMSEKVPYSEDQNNMLQLIRKIKGGYREKDIVGVPDEINNLIKECWEKDNLIRPSISEIYHKLLGLSRFIVK